MSHQQLPSAGTPPESAISAALRLAWRHRNSKSLLQGQSEALLAGQVHTQVAEAGKLYRVINAQDQIVTPEKAQRQGNHLVIVLKGNVQIIIQDFFAHTGKKGVQDGDEDRHLTSDSQEGTPVQAALFATDLAVDQAPAWEYAEGFSLSPEDSLLVQAGPHTETLLAGSKEVQDIQLAQAQMPVAPAMESSGQRTNDVAMALIGAVGLQLVANSGGSSTPNNGLDLGLTLGPVKDSNDLEVIVLKVNNNVVESIDKGAKFPAKLTNGRVLIDLGSFAGMVKVVIRDKAGNLDFASDFDETLQDAADGVDLISAFVTVESGYKKVNLNHVTTLAAKKFEAGGKFDAKTLNDVNSDVAKSLGLLDIKLQSDPVQAPSKSDAGNEYGIVNAMLSKPGVVAAVAPKLSDSTFVAKTDLKEALDNFVKSPVGQVNSKVIPIAKSFGITEDDVKKVDTLGPVFQGATLASVDETLATGGSVYKVKALDVQTVTYGLTDDTFMVNSTSGEITTKRALDFETKSTYTLTVSATDGSGNVTKQAITISVNDKNEAPALRKGAADAKVFVKGQLGTLNMSDYFADPDAKDVLSYKVMEGNLPGGITLTSEGVLSGKATGVEAERAVKVVATDKAGLVSSPVTFTLSSVDKPTVTKVQITDSQDTKTVGKPGDTVSVVLTIGEPVKLMGNLSNVTFNFKDAVKGNAVLFTGTAALTNETTITLTGTFEANKNSDNLIFDSMTVPDGVSLTGNTSQQLMVYTGYSLESGYKLDSQVAAPGIMLTSDTGMNASDGITGNGAVSVSGIEANAMWSYSIDGGTNWSMGAGSSFTLAAGSYAANDVQARQTDQAGNISMISKIAGALTVDTSAPTLKGVQFDTQNVILTFSEPLDSASLSTAGARFAFTLAGKAVADYAVKTVAAGALNTQIKLTLDSPAQTKALTDELAKNTPLNLAYADLTGANDATGVVQDVAGNDLADVKGMPIAFRPVVVAADISDDVDPIKRGKGGNAIKITLTLSEEVTLLQSASLANVTLNFADQLNGMMVDLKATSGAFGAAGSKTITFTGTLPATGNANDLVLTKVTVPTNALTGVSSKLPMESQDYALMTGYALDNTAPNAPLAALATDTGIATDGISSVGVVQVKNLAADVKTWEYNPGSGWVTGSGSAFTLAAGSYAANLVKVRQTDTVGQSSSETSLGAITIAPPAALMPALATDTGTSASDGVTRIGTLHVNTLEPGATWVLSTNGGSSWSPVSSGASTPLPEGSYASGSIMVRQIDSAGNSSASATLSGAVTVDTMMPTFKGASASGNKLTLMFSESLSDAANFVPTANDFNVTGKTVTAVSVAGKNVVLTLNSAYAFGEDVKTSTVSYTNAAGDATDIQDLAGNEAASFSDQVFTNDTPDRPSISGGALKGVSALDVRSNLVLSLNAPNLSLVKGKKIKIVNDDNEKERKSINGFADQDSKFNDIEITISADGTNVVGDTKVMSQNQDLDSETTLRLSPVTTKTPMELNTAIRTNNSIVKIVDNKLIIDPCIDLDFTNSYHIEFEAGAIKDANGLVNEALTDASVTKFRTVRPAKALNDDSLEDRAGTLSKTMSDAGALQDSYYWLDMTGRGDPLSDQFVIATSAIFNAANKKYAFAFADVDDPRDGAPPGTPPGLRASGKGFSARIFNFGQDDLIYADTFANPGEIEAKAEVQFWNSITDYVGVDASGQGQSRNAAKATALTPARMVSNFSAQEMRILLSLDPATPGLLNPNDSTLDTLEEVQASDKVRPTNLVEFQNKLHGSDLSLTTALLAVDPNNMKLHFVLG